MPQRINSAEFFDAVEDSAGFCNACKEIVNHGGCEPDARDYLCESCGSNSVYGMEEALLMDFITLSE